MSDQPVYHFELVAMFLFAPAVDVTDTSAMLLLDGNLLVMPVKFWKVEPGNKMLMKKSGSGLSLSRRVTGRAKYGLSPKEQANRKGRPVDMGALIPMTTRLPGVAWPETPRVT